MFPLDQGFPDRPLFYSLLLWVVHGAAIWVTAHTIKGIQVTGFLPAMLAALVLAAANHFLLPVLTILTLPVTFLTLGIFWLFLYGGMLKLSALIIPGFSVNGWFAAIVGAIFLSIVQGIFRFGFKVIMGT